MTRTPIAMSDLGEIEAIKQLKYRYFRCLDTKAWGELAECFWPDARCAYDSGRYSFEGRDAVMGFLEGAMGRASFVSLHQAHHPEIELTAPDAARGTWYLEDRVMDREHDFVLQGAAFYRDDYVRRDGEWRILCTGYERTFEEAGKLSALPLRLTRPAAGGSGDGR